MPSSHSNQRGPKKKNRKFLSSSVHIHAIEFWIAAKKYDERKIKLPPEEKRERDSESDVESHRRRLFSVVRSLLNIGSESWARIVWKNAHDNTQNVSHRQEENTSSFFSTSNLCAAADMCEQLSVGEFETMPERLKHFVVFCASCFSLQHVSIEEEQRKLFSDFFPLFRRKMERQQQQKRKNGT